MRKFSFSIVLALLGALLPTFAPAANAAPAATFGTHVQQNANGIDNFMTVSASTDGSKLIGAVQGGGAYRSIDYGKTWSPLTTLNALSPNDQWNASASSAGGSVLYMAALPGFIYRSQDAGATWTQIGSSRNWYQIATSSTGQYLFGAIGTATLYRSTDYGATFTTTTTAFGQDNVACSDNGQTVYVAESGHSIYKSTDYAATFASTGSASTTWRWIATNSTGSTVLAAAWASGLLYYSTNSGTSFSTATSAGSRQWTALSVSGDGTKMQAGVRGGGPAYKSTDSGATWSITSGAATFAAYSSDISNDGTRWFMNTWGSFALVSSDSGATFSSTGRLGLGANASMIQTLKWSADGAKAVGSFCNNSTVSTCWVVTSNDGGQNFFINLALGNLSYNTGSGATIGLSGDGLTIIAHETSDNSYYISRNFGSTWSHTVSPSTSGAAWVTFDLSTDGTKIVVAEDGGVLMYSADSGATFGIKNSTVSRWLGVSMNGDASVILVNKYPAGIFRSTDQGTTFTNVQPQGSGDLQHTAIAATGDTAVATNWNGKVWLSHDKGATWATTSASPTDFYHNASVSADGQVIVAGSFSNMAIAYSLDAGATWSSLATNVSTEVDAVAMSASANKLMYLGDSSTQGFFGALYVVDMTVTGLASVSSTNSNISAQAPISYAPQISKLNKRVASVLGGEVMTINGKNLDTVDTLKVDGKAIEIKSQDASSLMFVTPAHAIGLVAIFMSNSEGTLNFVNAFTYTAPKKVAAKMPAIPTTLKVKNSVTFTPVDATLLPTVSTTTPKVCSVAGLKVTAKKAGSCALKIAINVDQNDWFTKSNNGYYAIKITNGKP